MRLLRNRQPAGIQSRIGSNAGCGSVETMNPVFVNFVYALAGGLLTLVFMWVGYMVLVKLTRIDVAEELAKGNRAVGAMVMGLFIGIGIAMGLVVGLSLN